MVNTGVTYHAAMAVVEDVSVTDGVCSCMLYLWFSEIWSSMLLILVF
jgi:hypothetical protein